MADKPKLYLIPSPIAESNLDLHMPPIVPDSILGIKHFLVENVRTARRYISSFGMNIEISELIFYVLDKRSTTQDLNKMMQPLNKGYNLGVISEAGCPGIADPGAKAVDWAHRHDFPVVPLVGPSSLFLALMASGFNGQKFAFHGYLPISDIERVKAIQQLERESAQQNQTQIFIEAPYRNKKLLEAIVKFGSPSTKLCIARDITGAEEMVVTKSLAEWKKSLPDVNKIPTVFLLYSGVFD